MQGKNANNKTRNAIRDKLLQFLQYNLTKLMSNLLKFDFHAK